MSTAAAVPRLRDHPRLLVLTIGSVMLETALVWATGLSSALGLAPQVSAPAPFDIFHDLRWVLVYHRSWASFGAEVALLLVFRSLFDAYVIRCAWPAARPAPSLAALAGRALAFTAVGGALLSPWAALVFGMAVTPVSWLFFVAIPCALFVALLIHHGVVVRRWWARPPAWRTTGWILATFVVLTLDGAAMTASPAALRLPVAAAAGLFNAWAWFGVVQATAGRTTSTRFIPLAPVGLVALAATVVTGVAVGFAKVAERPPSRTALGTPASGTPVMIVSGFGTKWDGIPTHPLPGPFDERRFSYRGQDAAGNPLPYSTVDTHRPLAALVRDMAAQVAAAARADGRPISVVAESEGALVAKAFVAARPGAPVDQLVLLSPLVDPGRVYYPPRGREGWGVAAASELRWITTGLDQLSPIDLTPDAPVLRSIIDGAPALRGLLPCPVDGVRQLALFPLADAVASPHPSHIGIDFGVVPAFHGGLLGSAAVQRTVALQLTRPRPRPFGVWFVIERAVRAASSAWQVPDLPLTLNPAWGPPHARQPGCAAMISALRRQMG